MDQQHNQKSLIPEFTTNGFNGIPHGGTNSLMSTLQSLQIQSMGNSMMPSSDLQCDLPNQFFLEQIQLRAMQSVYNSFGQKLDNQLPSQSFQQTQGSLALPFNAITTNDVSTSNTAFASISTLPQNIEKYGNGSKPETSKVQTDFTPKHLGNNFAMDILSNSNPMGDHIGGAPKTTQMEDWMRTICVDSLLDPLRDKQSTSSAQTAPTIHQTTGSSREECSSHVSEQIRPESHHLPSSSTEPSKVPADAFFDEAHDDVDNIFGLSLAENDDQSNSMFRRPGSADRGLSPIDFTPPDSPHEELTLDMLFGLPPDSSQKDSSSKSQRDIFSTDIPTTSTDLFSPRNDLRLTSSSPNRSSKDVQHTFSKPNKIPVYKQKAALMSLEARTAARKENPNYDAFEFEDDEELAGPAPAEMKREIEVAPKHEAKVKSVYIPGIGFEITNKGEQDGGGFSVRKPMFRANAHEAQQDKSFFTLADSLRERKDQSLTCSFLKPSQSNDTECSKNMRFARPSQPKLPKLIIRVQHVQLNTEDSVGPRKRAKKKKMSNDEDSDWDDVVVRKRKINKKLYTLHSEEEVLARRPQVDNLHAMGPNCCEFVRKRLSSFGPAEGILPKGTYVVCKADVLRDDCAIWRVDNQNLLQKFPPFREVHTNKQVYRSSSTYSGWCEQISSQYLRVAVRVLKQNRSETTIEPEIPLLDLFPAMSAEMFKTPRAVYIKEGQPTPVDDSSMLSDIRRVSLNTVISALLNQVFTSNYIQLLLEKNDWSYVRSLSEIENANKEAEQRIRSRIPVENKHDKYIEEYTRLAVSRSSFNCLTKCQICKRKRPRRVIHFFDKKTYNNNTLSVEISAEPDENLDDVSYPVVDAISCGRCATAVEILHRMRHFQLHILRLCEEKLEEIGTAEIDLSTEKNVDLAKADKSWIMSVIEKYCDMWNEARLQFRDV